MQYLLSEEEYAKLKEAAHLSAVREDTVRLQSELITDLRKKVMELGEFRCFHDLPDDSLVYVDEGYCDDCPLSFCENESKKTKYKMCGRGSTLHSK
jgi:hypothetical protein